MILEEVLNKLIRDITDLILVTPGYTIKAKQNAPRPQGGYATVDFISDTGLGWEQSQFSNTPIVDLEYFSFENSPSGQTFGDVNNAATGGDFRGVGDPLTDGPDVQETIQGVREVFFSLDFYRDNARDNARKVRTGFTRNSIQSLMTSAGVGLARRSEVRELSEALENGWEERTQFDLVFNTVGTDSDIIKSILTANISGEYQARGLKYNFDIEVN